MNWTNRFLMTATLATALLACDSFQDDMEPDGSEQLQLKANVSALPNTDVYIDLKQAIRTSENIKFEIHTAPQKGTATISAEAILHYHPLVSFTNGTDLIALNLINSAGAIVDSDSIVISMVSSADSLPCFNGALSDHFYTEKNQSVILRPLSNDGFCPDTTSGASITFFPGPQFGTLQHVDHFTYNYTPPVDFVGVDSWMYELELIDKNGNSSVSLAKITVDVKASHTSGPCDSLLTPYHFVLDNPFEPYYYFDAFNASALCDFFEWDIQILETGAGSATVTDNGQIKYFPPAEPDSSDYIRYIFSALDFSRENYIYLDFSPNTSGGGDTCTFVAQNDVYYLEIVTDSVGSSTLPHYLYVSQNDDFCGEATGLVIVQHPEIGTAEVLAEHMKIKYWVDEEFTGTKETSFKYRICSDSVCSEAWVHLTIHKI